MARVTPSVERTPQQSRSRASWDRVLQVGMDLFAERGWEGLTIAEVCRRADVTAPSIYARVDGKADLFRAVHERWLLRIRDTEAALRAEYVRAGMDAPDAAAAAARVVLGVFDGNGSALRAQIDRSASDPQLLQRGSAAVRDMLATLAETIPVPRAQADTITRAVFAECLMRVMYGSEFLDPVGESPAVFRKRVENLARTLAGS